MNKISRRRFTQLLGGASVLGAGTIAIKDVSADGHSNLLDPESPAAKGLQFVLVSDNNTNCAGCIHYRDDGSEAKGKCNIFPENLVPAEAWCAAFQPTP